MKKLEKAKANQELDNNGMNVLLLSIFVQEFEIPEEHVINFLSFCAEDHNFNKLVYSDNPLELFEYYQGKGTYYLKDRM